jgi:N-glycosylase/DNA lyase
MKHARLPLLPASRLGAARLAERQPLFLALPEDEPFDLHHTFRCGQSFRWRLHGDTWYGPYGAGSLAVRQVPGGIEVRVAGLELPESEVAAFLGMHVQLGEVYHRLRGDRWVHAAIQAVPGMRLLRQDPWECLLNFICSQNSNIPKIERSTERLSREWGTVHRWEDGIEVASLPSPEALAELPPEALGICGLGYRCRYLVGSARLIATGAVPLGSLRELSYADALEALLRLPGIGRKVADCILLFSLDQPQACPVDVWVRRVIHELYPQALRRYLPDAADRIEKPLSTREYEAIVRFAEDRWGMLAGHAQQYLFHARRHRLIGPDTRPSMNEALAEQSAIKSASGLSDPPGER